MSDLRAARLRALPFLVAALLLAFGPARPPARADEAGEAGGEGGGVEAPDPRAELLRRLDALTDQVRARIREKNEPALEADAAALVALHKEAEGQKDIRRKAVDLLGEVAKAAKGDGLAVAALTALGDTEDPDAARHLKPHLGQRDAGAAPPPLVAAIRAARKVPDAALVGPLLKVFEKSKHNGAAREAMESLGYFRHLKSQRTRILEAIIESVRRSKPGVKGNQKDPLPGEQASASGDAARNRWDALRQAMPPTLSRLTGRDLYGVTAEEWFSMVDEYKGRTADLFLDPEPR